MSRYTLYDSEYATVEFYDGDDITDNLVVTFNSHIPPARMAQIPTNPLKGGWNREVEAKLLKGMYLIEKDNLWFNLPDLEKFLKAVKLVRDEFKTCTVLGASLGAHAAIRLSKRLDATVTVAVSPQFCMNPKHVGHFEKRWSSDVAKISRYDWPISRETVSGDIYIISDNMHAVDAQHVDMIAKAVDVKRIVNLPYSGHSSARALADLNLIDAILNIKRHNAKVFLDHIEDTYAKRWQLSPTALRVRAEHMEPQERMQFLNSISNVVGLQQHRDALDDLIRKTRSEV